MSQTPVLFAICAILGCLTATSSASADAPSPAVPAGSWLDQVAARAELGLTGRSDPASRLWVVSPLIGLDYRFSHGFGIGFDWGFVLASEVPQHRATQWLASPGNPLLNVWYENDRDAVDHVHLYAGLSVPLAWLPRDSVRRGLARTGYAFAAATRGLWNAWLWVPEQLALALGGLYTHRLASYARLRVDAAAAGSVSLSWLTREVGSIYGQLAPALELSAGPLQFGVRAQAVAVAPQSDPLQLSAGVYVGFEQESWAVVAHGSCNLDPPLGIFGSGLGVCGTWISAAVSP